MSEEFLMKPKVDFVFKEIMMDEQARLGFLSAALHIAPENIRETRILNTYLRKEHRDDKQGISQDEQKRMEYTARLKSLFSIYSRVNE